MQEMTKRIIRACNLDASSVDEFGTDEYWIDDGIRNLRDLGEIYGHFVKSCGDPALVADYGKEFLGWEVGAKAVFNGTEADWNEMKGEDDWDFPQDELADILSGELSDGVAVYVRFTDGDGEARYGEVSSLNIEEARKHFGTPGTFMETLA